MRGRLTTTCAAIGLGAVVAGCGGGSDSPASAQPPPAVAPATSSNPMASPGVPSTAPSLSMKDVADPGLPSRVGPGKLSNGTIKRLVQYFEDKVAKAYADGDADALAHYLAGPMLSGNRATILLLEKQHKRNIFRINVKTVDAQVNNTEHVIVDMTGDMVLDYFADTRTHKVLNNGLPGPSQVQFAIFLDRNPQTGTWYWTGEQSETTGGSAGMASR